MRRINNLYYHICNIENIRFIYDKIVSKNTKNKRKVLDFDDYYIINILYIQYILSKKLYIPGKYNIFFIKEPKIRVIMSQNMFDKIINHLVSFYILKPSIEHCLIEQNIATRVNKGTDYGIKLVKKYINEIKINNNSFYILKFDISKYFYNIDHLILKKLLSKKIKDKYALKIIFDIIDSTNRLYINEKIKSIIKLCKEKCTDLHIIKELENIPIYRYEKGLPIGNMTSQILAIFYLNDLDHFIKEKLKINYYIRYMDDGVLIHKDKKYLQYCLKEINKIIVNDYKLELNSKTKIYSIREGFEFLGFRYYLKDKKLITKVVTSTKKRYKRKIRKFKQTDLKKCRQIIASYNGHLQYANSRNLIYEVTNNLIDYI